MAEFTPVTQLNQEAQAGWDAQQAEARKATAYNALRQQYGDQAGDPQAALEMQKYGFDQQNNPQVLQGNALSNQAAQQKITFDQADDPLRLQGDQQKLDNNAIMQQSNTLDVQAKQRAAQSQHAQMLHGVFSGTLDGLEKEAAGVDDPTQRAALFDKHAGTITAMAGMDDPATQAELAKEKARFVAGGAAAIPGMRSDLDAATQAQMTPKEIADQKLAGVQLEKAQSDAATSKSKADAAASKAAATQPGAAMSPGQLDKTVLNWTKINGKPDDIRGKIDAIKGYDSKVNVLLGTGATGGFNKDPDRVASYGADGLIPQTLALVEKTKGMSAIQRQLQGHIPGSDVYKLNNNLDQISHSAALVDLNNLKQGGTSLGRVTNAEFGALSQALINANSTADYSTLKQGLNKLGDMYMQTHNAALNSVTARQGQLAGYKNLVRGTIYADPNDPDQAAPASGLTTPAPVGATGGATTPAGAGVIPPPGPNAAPPLNPATATPADLQKAGVLSPDQTSTPAPAATDTGAQATPVSLPAGQRLIPNFAAATSTQPLQQAMNDPATMRQLPAGMRNNNPGNIKFAHQAGTTPSANTDEGDPQAVYATPQAGMDAMARLVTKRFNQGHNTTDSLIASEGTGWTPGNHAAAANVAKTMGITPNTPINMNDPLQKAAFMRALMFQEHGPKSRLYPDSMILAAVGAPTGAQPGATTPDTQNDVPGNGPTPPANQQTVAQAGPVPTGGAPAAGGGMQQMADVTPRGAAVPTAQPSAPEGGAAKLAGMTPMQVAQQPVTLPSAADLVGPNSNALASAARGGQHVAVLSNVHNILQQYGLRRKA